MAKYSVSVDSATAGADPQTLINLFSTAGGNRGYIYDFSLGSVATPADQAGSYDMIRTTAVGTEASGYTPVLLDLADGASTLDSGVSHTVEPTQSGNELMRYALNQRATFRWVASPNGELVIPATTGNGIAMTRRASTAAYEMDAYIHFYE